MSKKSHSDFSVYSIISENKFPIIENEEKSVPNKMEEKTVDFVSLRRHKKNRKPRNWFVNKKIIRVINYRFKIKGLKLILLI